MATGRRELGEWVLVGGDALCEHVVREADRLGVRINPFWLHNGSHSAEIDGDRHSHCLVGRIEMAVTTIRSARMSVRALVVGPIGMMGGK